MAKSAFVFSAGLGGPGTKMGMNCVLFPGWCREAVWRDDTGSDTSVLISFKELIKIPSGPCGGSAPRQSAQSGWRNTRPFHPRKQDTCFSICCCPTTIYITDSDLWNSFTIQTRKQEVWLVWNVNARTKTTEEWRAPRLLSSVWIVFVSNAARDCPEGTLYTSPNRRAASTGFSVISFLWLGKFQTLFGAVLRYWHGWVIS